MSDRSSETQAVGQAMPPSAAGRFVWRGVAVALVGGPLLGAITAWGAHVAAGYFAPLVVFPLLVGTLLGAMFAGLLRLVEMAHRPLAWLGLLLAVAVAIAGQHYLAYRAAYAAALEDAAKFDKARAVAPEDLRGRLPRVPDSPLDFLQTEARRGRPIWNRYLAQDAWAWTSWAVDGLLLLGAASWIVFPALRQPYCNQCLSWFHTVRSGRVDTTTLARLAQALGPELLQVPDQTVSARYRLLSCRSGCGPTGFELIFTGRRGKSSLFCVWLDAEVLTKVQRALGTH